MKSFQSKVDDTPPDDDPGNPPAPDATAKDQTEPTETETAPMPRPDRQSRNAEVDFRGGKRSNATHASTTNPDARLYKKSPGADAMLCFMGHASRTARSRTSGENLFVVLLMMLHPTQELEPPANPARVWMPPVWQAQSLICRRGLRSDVCQASERGLHDATGRCAVRKAGFTSVQRVARARADLPLVFHPAATGAGS